MPEPRPSLIDPKFLGKLERLRLRARRAFPGTTRGERRSTRRGSSVEFADFRQYEPGDDYRHVDWNIYARLEKLMLRQFVEEEDLRVDILIDSSASMRFGSPMTKLDFARRLAAALSLLAIDGHDRVGISLFDSVLGARVPASRGRGHLKRILTFLDALKVDQAALPETVALTNIADALTAYYGRTSRPGVVFVLSDFLDAGAYRRSLGLLAHNKFDVNLIQILSPEEIEPELSGDLALVDAESGAICEISAIAGVGKAYAHALTMLTEGLETIARSCGSGYALVRTDRLLEDVLLRDLPSSGMVI